MEPQFFVPWGTPATDKLSSSTFRIFYQNPNGIKVTDNDHSLKLMHQHLYEQQVSIACFAETNLEWNHDWVKKKLERTGRTRWNSFRATTSTSERVFKNSYKPGGTMMFVTGALKTRLTQDGSDPHGMGRWTYQTFRGKDDIKVTFITAYRVTRQSITTAGSTTSYFQQFHHMRLGGNINPNPRKRILTDLKALIEQLRSDRHDVMISLDANESFDGRSEIQEFFEETVQDY